jgi:hypothetical protein
MNTLIDLNKRRKYTTVTIGGKEHQIKLAGTIEVHTFVGKMYVTFWGQRLDLAQRAIVPFAHRVGPLARRSWDRAAARSQKGEGVVSWLVTNVDTQNKLNFFLFLYRK